MSSKFSDIVSAALDEAISFIGDSVVIGSRQLSAVVNNVALTEEVADAGLIQNRGITVVLSKTTTVPKIGSTLIYNGKRYRILEVSDDVAGLELLCATDAK